MVEAFIEDLKDEIASLKHELQEELAEVSDLVHDLQESM